MSDESTQMRDGGDGTDPGESGWEEQLLDDYDAALLHGHAQPPSGWLNGRLAHLRQRLEASYRLRTSQGTVPVPIASAPGIPGYQIGDKLGEGGMGIVYRARQLGADRDVALKMIRPGLWTDDAARRFRQEAGAAAGLDHANIVPIYQVGEQEGQPFYTMKLINGPSLASCLPTTADPPMKADPKIVPALEPHRAACLMEKVARAVHHAHQRGILHRDLKPANILLDEHDQPHVADFGLAKRIGDPGSMSQPGAVIGTPQYMAPEQATAAGTLTTAADVYSLGAILYALLTGRPPFDGSNALEVLAMVCSEEPDPPSRACPGLPRDLETICLKCLHKEPPRRYPSAEALADDLKRFLAGEPISARPVGKLERAWRWARRNPVLAVLVLLLVGVIVVSFVDAVAFGLREARLRETADRNFDDANRSREEIRDHLYARQIALADQELAGNHPLQADALLDGCPKNLRGWEWHYLSARSRGRRPFVLDHRQGTWAVSYSPDGRRLASTSIDGAVRIWETATNREERPYLGHSLPGFPVPVLCADFSPGDGAMVASAGIWGDVHLWEAATGKRIRKLQHGPAPTFIIDVRFSPDGKRLASAGWDNTAKVWDAATGDLLFPLPDHTDHVNSVAWSSDGRYLATASFDRTVRLWDARDGKALRTLTGHDAAVRSVAFSPVGPPLLASAGLDGTVRIWDATDGTAVKVLTAHHSPVLTVAFSPDGRRLASGSFDKTVKVWETKQWQEVLALRGHGDMIWGLAWTPDGGRLATASFDRSVRVWDGSAGDVGGLPGKIERSDDAWLNGVAFSPDGERVAYGGWSGVVHVWRPGADRDVLTLSGHKSEIWGVAYSPDGKRIASASWDKTVRLWDARTGQELVNLPHKANAHGVSFSPDGKMVVTTAWDGNISLWDAVTGKEIRSPFRHEAGYPAYAAVFSPDSERLVTAGGDKTAKVWDVKSGKLLHTLKGHRAAINSVAFDATGKRVATSGWDDVVRVWDVATGKEQMVLSGHANRVNAVAFSPDGRRLASGSEDKTVRLWNATTGEELTRFDHRESVWAVAFRPDGQRLASAGWDRKVCVWEVPR